MLASIPSATLHGVVGHPVAVEVHVSSGLPGFTVVGLPDAAVRESRDRVRAALLSSGMAWPGARVTVNLAPSGVRKTGAGLDLAVAAGLLVATGSLAPASVAGTGFVGELGLDGSLRPVPGTVPLVHALACRRVVVPAAAAAEAALVAPGRVCGAGSLAQVVGGLQGRCGWAEPGPGVPGGAVAGPDLAEVRGQPSGRRALEIAAAGGHHLLLVGPPGSGKSMLATRLAGLLPPLEDEDALEVLRISSAAGIDLDGDVLPRRPPFRAPHHGVTDVALVGGGSGWLRPGEVSLAHGGVLFLDELGEFSAAVLDALRQPLEEGVIRVRRARAAADLPARFILVGAMNPCPCGEGTTAGACRCTELMRARYLRRLSAPLLDRFDLAVTLQRPEVPDLLGGSPGEPTATVAGRVRQARTVAAARSVRANGDLAPSVLDTVAPLSPRARSLLEHRLVSGALSARGLHRVRRVARTIADLDGVDRPVGEQHVAEALALRAARGGLLPGAA